MRRPSTLPATISSAQAATYQVFLKAFMARPRFGPP
jgi:hypothetical protein